MILSELMLAELRYISQTPVKLRQVRNLHQSTLKSLLNRKLVQRYGDQIECTNLGIKIIYKRQLNKRKFEANVSESVLSLLHVSKILAFRKAS